MCFLFSHPGPPPPPPSSYFSCCPSVYRIIAFAKLIMKSVFNSLAVIHSILWRDFLNFSETCGYDQRGVPLYLVDDLPYCPETGSKDLDWLTYSVNYQAVSEDFHQFSLCDNVPDTYPLVCTQ